MTITFFTGPCAPDAALAAAATAAHSAASGERTLLFSVGPAHYLPFGVPPARVPQPFAPDLDVLAFDALAALDAMWEQGRANRPAQLSGTASEELPVPPGIEMILGFQQIATLAADYPHLIVATGSHDALLRGLALVDGLRWSVRLLFGLDRGPGRSADSVGRALLPTSFLPLHVIDGAQDLRITAEQARATITDPAHASVRFVLPATPPALAEARLAVPALQLHGLHVSHVLVGPARTHGEIFEAARQIWASRPVLAMPNDQNSELAALAALGAQISGDSAVPLVPPIAFAHAGQAALVIALPGLPNGAITLTLSGDELIVRIGPYRRHMLLPDGLRGVTSIKAVREGELLIVRKR